MADPATIAGRLEGAARALELGQARPEEVAAVMREGAEALWPMWGLIWSL